MSSPSSSSTNPAPGTTPPTASSSSNTSNAPARSSATSSSSSSKRPPALSDIAAKLKIEDKVREKDPATDTANVSESPTKVSRLAPAGRLGGALAGSAPQAVGSTEVQNAEPIAGVEPSSSSPKGQAEARAPSSAKDITSPTPNRPSTQDPNRKPILQRTASGAPKPEKPKLHPLQHVWSLYFDSKTFNNNASATPSPNPNSAKSGTEKKKEGDNELQQQQQQNSTLQPGSKDSLQPPTTPSSLTVASKESWEAQLKFLGKYNTVEAFFKTFATLRRPSSLDRNSNYHLFKDGIKPMWEDPANANGGKWVLTLRGTNPALLDRTWMWLVLALVGEDLDDKNEITGAVCSTRPKGDRIALWIRIKDDIERVNRIGRKLVSLLDVEKEPGVSLEFVSNAEGRRGSAFRSHGGHHNNMRNGSFTTASKSGDVEAATGAVASAGGDVEAPKDGEANASSPEIKTEEAKGDESVASKADESTSSSTTSASGGLSTAPRTSPSKYISFSNPPPSFGPGQQQGGQGYHQHHPHHNSHHQQSQFNPQFQQQQAFQQHFPGQQGGFMPPGAGGPFVGGGMPGMFPPGMGGAGGMAFPPGFLPTGLGGLPQGQQPNPAAVAAAAAQLQAAGAQGQPNLMAAAAAAGIPPQNMHYFQHQLLLQQQAFMAQAQLMAAQQQQQQQQQQMMGGGGSNGNGPGRQGLHNGGQAFQSQQGSSGPVGGTPSSPDKSGGGNSLSTSPSKFGTGGGGGGSRRGSEFGVAGGGAFGSFARKGSEAGDAAGASAFGSPIGRKAGLGGGASGPAATK